MTENQESRIRERAYRLWQDEGSPEGRDKEHWAQAEAEIAEEDAKAAPASASVEAAVLKNKKA